LMKDRSAWELAHVPMVVQPVDETEAATLPGNALASPALMGA